MSALPLSIHDLSIPDLSIPDAAAPEIRDGLPARPVDRAGTIARPRTTSANWQLTDRGIAVVMVIVALIMAAALAVIGLTVLRVTSGDYGSGTSERVQTFQATPF
jgi:hypothetical protein